MNRDEVLPVSRSFLHLFRHVQARRPTWYAAVHATPPSFIASHCQTATPRSILRATIELRGGKHAVHPHQIPFVTLPLPYELDDRHCPCARNANHARKEYDLMAAISAFCFGHSNRITRAIAGSNIAYK